MKNSTVKIRNSIIGFFYRNFLKKIYFLIDPEKVHDKMVGAGEILGKFWITRKLTSIFFSYSHPALKQTVCGINFNSPVGLSAGFDYGAWLPKITPSIGFGFETIGTITYSAYEGNPKPMLGRLPKSKSLLVNKGFKNDGAVVIAKKMTDKFSAKGGSASGGEIPIGVSIGRTNSPELGQKESVDDIVKAFKIFEDSGVANLYYELNISCPNLYGNVNFYEPDKLEELLCALDKMEIKKPIFIKMPIEKSNAETVLILEAAKKHRVAGVIFGNLQKNRKDPSFFPEEVAKCAKGNFSGRPTFERSNELIELTRKIYKERFVIIGCGGIFNAEDAYRKIKLGASLVQMITGMIFEGPQVMSEINRGLVELLQRDGYSNISEAVGTANL